LIPEEAVVVTCPLRLLPNCPPLSNSLAARG
jgi:hypothetical protein